MKLTEKQTNIMLFCTLCILWGFTWVSGKYQINAGILPEFAVAYRFFGITFVILISSVFVKQNFKITKQDIKILIPYAFMCCSINFIIFYYVAGLMITSISAIIFSFGIIIIALLKHFLKIASEDLKTIMISALIGIMGLVFIMLQKLNIKITNSLEIGVLLAFIATFLYASGSLFYERKRSKLTLNPVSAFFYVSIFGSIISFSIGILHTIIFNAKLQLIPNLSFSFVASYAYLVFSGFGILFMMMLIQRIGAVKASYTNLITPVLAVLTSAILEDYKIILSTIIGIVLIIISNYIALNRKKSKS